MTFLSDMIPWNKPMSPTKQGDTKKYLLLHPQKSNVACPLGIDIRTVLHLLSQGEIEKALLSMKEHNPFPIVCGRLCTHACEKEALQKNLFAHSALEEIKRNIALYEETGKFLPPPPYPVLYQQRIAIIGAGVAGLTVALDLCRLGYSVSVFEKKEKACSSLYGSLAKEFHKVLDKEIVFIQERGVKIFLQKEISSLDFVLAGFHVVVIATGKDSRLFPQNNPKNVFSVSQTYPEQSILECLDESHRVALKIVQTLQNKYPDPETKSPLPVLRQYQASCPYHASNSSSIASKDKIVALSSATKCLHCGLWKKPEEFTQEGCLNCIECEHCLASCGFKQVFVTTEKECFLAKTTESIADDLYPDKEIDLFSEGKKVCSLRSIVPNVSEASCVACGRCEDVCPYHAVRIAFRKGKHPVAVVDPKACRGCTLCVSACPNNAIQHFLFHPKNLYNNKPIEKKTAFFSCRWNNSFENFQSSSFNAMCTRYATPKIFLLALWHGADQVRVSPCAQDHCHYLGSSHVSQKIHKCHQLLTEIGIPTESVAIANSTQETSTPEPLPRHQATQQKSYDLAEAFLAMQSFETFTAKPQQPKEPSALILGGSVLLEKLLEAEEILPRGTFVESIRILLQSIAKPVSLLPGISSLDIPWQEPAMQKKALENLQFYTQNPEIKEMIFAYPELYQTHLSHCINKIALPLVLQKKLSFKKCNLTVALHKPCYNHHYNQTLLEKRPGNNPSLGKSMNQGQEEQAFFHYAIELLQEVPGLKIIPILDSCGHGFFRTHDHTQREVAYNLLHQSRQNKADLLLTLSPYCSNHISFMLRKGSWQEIAIETKDMYSFLLECLK